jgi:hypothetical protein
MTGYEIGLLLGGLAVGVVLGWLLARKFHFFADGVEGTITITPPATPNGTAIVVSGTYTHSANCRLARLYTYLHTAGTAPGDSPPSTATDWPPQDAGVFTLNHPFTGTPTGTETLYVYGAFAIDASDSVIPQVSQDPTHPCPDPTDPTCQGPTKPPKP